MLRRVAHVRIDVSEECISNIKVTRIGELGTTLAVTINRRMLQRNISQRALVATRHNFLEDSILYQKHVYLYRLYHMFHLIVF
jgi:hypothetical protein